MPENTYKLVFQNLWEKNNKIIDFNSEKEKIGASMTYVKNNKINWDLKD